MPPKKEDPDTTVMPGKNSTYLELSKIDLSNLVEKTLQKHSYISWVDALRVLLEKYGYNLNWQVHTNEQGLPYFKTDWDGAMVCVSTWINEQERIQWHPVITHTNKPIIKPDVMAINNAIQRCLAKCLALHGLGLYIYAGEDMPPTVQNPDRDNLENSAPVNQSPAPAKKLAGALPTKGMMPEEILKERNFKLAKWKSAAEKKGLNIEDIELLVEAAAAFKGIDSKESYTSLVNSDERFDEFLNYFGELVLQQLKAKDEGKLNTAAPLD